MAESIYVHGKTRFRWIEAILADPQLTAGQKTVAARLFLHFNGSTGLCYPALPTLAVGCAMTRQGVQKALRGLKDHGWITFEEVHGRARRRYFHLFMKKDNQGLPLDMASHPQNANSRVLKGQQTSQIRQSAVGPNLKVSRKANLNCGGAARASGISSQATVSFALLAQTLQSQISPTTTPLPVNTVAAHPFDDPRDRAPRRDRGQTEKEIADLMGWPWLFELGEEVVSRLCSRWSEGPISKTELEQMVSRIKHAKDPGIETGAG